MMQNAQHVRAYFVWSFERGSPERFHTNEYEPNSHKGLTSLLIKNLKTMDLWASILIWYLTSYFYLMWDLDSDSQHLSH